MNKNKDLEEFRKFVLKNRAEADLAIKKFDEHSKRFDKKFNEILSML